MKVKSTADWLTRAKQLLIEQGWIQNAARDRHGRCLHIALQDIAQGDTTTYAYGRAAFGLVNQIVDERMGRESSIAEWNDGVARSIDDVLVLLDEAIRRAA